MNHARSFFDELNQRYRQLLKTEGELYWSVYTGQSDAHDALAEATLNRKMFSGDASRLVQAREHFARVLSADPSAERDALVTGLQGWINVLEANAIPTDRAACMLSELTALDADLFARRQAYKMTHINAEGLRVNASPSALRNNLASNPDESARKSAHDALHSLEHWVASSGFADIVGKRNALARELGYRNFFEYRLKTHSGMAPEQLFAVFDEFERSTRDAHQASLNRVVEKHGRDALLPQNLSYAMQGGTTEQGDAYFPLSKAPERWAESFRRMGVSYRGARIEIDLLEREGKFPTGFCIAPTPGYRDDNLGPIAADVRFTSTARPSQPGAGLRGLTVLFHEAGHAAHFANVDMNSPCFSQEFPPSSPALLEAQAKFFDALPSDPCWLKRYAKDAAGNPMPDELIRARVEARQAYLAYTERRDLIPTYFEWALYCMDDSERTPDSVLALARSVTERILGIPGHTDYVLATPHPIYHDMAVYYHGYLLAKIAAAQTRAYLTRALGYIVDNPEVGRLLATHCWAPGNSVTLDQTLIALTGEPLSPSYLAAQCNRSPDDAWRQASDTLLRGGKDEDSWVSNDLDANISLVHGSERIADNDESLPAMCNAFERWIESYSERSLHANAS
ncbi:M3 family metallopeptidase [Trinickia dinghuensis]|uniref:Peptidase M3 n=1 Tax=Trinickia dinghuensis TaxID=2291023 RepID=A0A3D8K0N7_9BURK|nr:M3 family metallopeptidase [Trinickia dinghuensis]RDU99017.1 peptidase M3 [Trinickia dinghuensis]